MYDEMEKKTQRFMGWMEEEEDQCDRMTESILNAPGGHSFRVGAGRIPSRKLALELVG